MQPQKIQGAQMWGALLLTAGEFVAAIYLVVHDGHILALYLAVTYAMRETEGGKRYHHVVCDAFTQLPRVIKRTVTHERSPIEVNPVHVRAREDCH